MKTLIAIVAILIASTVYAMRAHPFQATVTVTHTEVPSPAIDIALTLTPPTAQPSSRPQAPKVGAKAHPVAARQKAFVCGPMHDNAVGGRNRDCE